MARLSGNVQPKNQSCVLMLRLARWTHATRAVVRPENIAAPTPNAIKIIVLDINRCRAKYFL